MHLKLVHAYPLRGDYQAIKQSYPVWVYPFEIMVPWHMSETKIERKIDIAWDPKKTTVISAYASCEGHASSAWGATRIILSMNDVEIYNQFWYPWEDCQKRDKTENVSGTLLNGTNKFNATMVKGGPFNVYARIGLSVIVEYEGEKPVVKPTPPEWFEYVKWPLVGLGVVAALFIGLKVFEAVKRS